MRVRKALGTKPLAISIVHVISQPTFPYQFDSNHLYTTTD